MPVNTRAAPIYECPFTVEVYGAVLTELQQALSLSPAPPLGHVPLHAMTPGTASQGRAAGAEASRVAVAAFGAGGAGGYGEGGERMPGGEGGIPWTAGLGGGGATSCSPSRSRSCCLCVPPPATAAAAGGGGGGVQDDSQVAALRAHIPELRAQHSRLLQEADQMRRQ
ncbi:hypothetical protein HaLaN_29167, partial [Haematococcus lacustris]